jgi:hypothetical protein
MQRFMQGLVVASVLAIAGCDQTAVSPAAALVSGEHGITAIASDGAFVYWSTVNGAVKRVSIDGGKPETLVPGGTEGLSSAGHLQVDAKNVYWTTSATVMAMPKGGAMPVVLAGQSEPLSDLTGLAADDGSEYVYFTETAGFVRKAPKIAGDMVTLVSGEVNPTSPVVHGASLYWTAGATAASASGVRVLDVEGGTPSTVPINPASPFGQISVDDVNVYWGADGVVSWAPLAGGDATSVGPAGTSSTTGPAQITAVLGIDTNVFWGDVTGTVSTAPVLPSETPDVLATGPAGLLSLTVDAANLYWANSGDGTIVVMSQAWATQASTAGTPAMTMPGTPTPGAPGAD